MLLSAAVVPAVLGDSSPLGAATASSDGLSSLAGKSPQPELPVLGVRAALLLPPACPSGSLSPRVDFRSPPLLPSRRECSAGDTRSLRLRSLRPIAGEEWLRSLRRVPLAAEPIGEDLGLELPDPLPWSSSSSWNFSRGTGLRGVAFTC